MPQWIGVSLLSEGTISVIKIKNLACISNLSSLKLEKIIKDPEYLRISLEKPDYL